MKRCILFYLPCASKYLSLQLAVRVLLLLRLSSSIPEYDYIAVPSNVTFVPNLTLGSQILTKVGFYPVYQIDILSRH